MNVDLTGTDAATEDAFLGGALTVLQPRNGYRAGLDAVLLAAAAPAGAERSTVLDAGSGVGVVGLCVATRCPQAHVTLVEREPALAALARMNVTRNAMMERVQVVEADIETGAASIAAGSQMHTLANPPYQTTGRGRRPANDLKAASHQMQDGGLDRWARFLARVTADDGTVTIIHRADALPDLLASLDGRFGALLVTPVYARERTAALRVLIGGIKGSRAPLQITQPLILHEPAGGFTRRVDDVLRTGAPLDVHQR